MKLPLPLGLAGMLALSLAGCATVETVTYPPPTGDPVADGRAIATRVPARDRMLWDYRTAATAMRRGRFADAKALLDDAVVTLNGIYGPDRDAQKARSLFQEESRKKFLGEPYERVMAYYYRGILYWMDGEPDNARACFRSAQLADSNLDDQSYAADYVLLDYLDGLASAKLSADGSDAYRRALAACKGEAPPAYNVRANVLFFVECGRGPAKYAAGQYGEQLRFREGPAGARAATLKVAGQTLRALPYDDLYFQATTRGGRVMDHVLAKKAVFKSATDTVGDAAIISGAVLASHRGRNSKADEVGAGLLLFGLASKLVSAATTPNADTRAWDNLPQFLSFAAVTLPAGSHPVTVEFQSATGSPLPTLTKTLTVNVVAAPRDTVVFLSDQ